MLLSWPNRIFSLAGPCLLLLLLLLPSAWVRAQLAIPAPAASSAAADIRIESPAAAQARLAQVRPDLEVIWAGPSLMPGYHVLVLESGARLYMSAAGTHVFVGDVYDITDGDLLSLSEEERAQQRRRAFTTATADAISFMPAGELRAQLIVYTDIECGYCRILHRDMAALNQAGVAVHYLAFPRNGLESEGYQKLVTAWCSADPQQAITRLKDGEPLPPQVCDNPVAAHYRMGKLHGVTGTPFMVLEDGEAIPGYMPVPRLLQELRERGHL